MISLGIKEEGKVQETRERSALLSLRRALNISRLDLVRVADISLGTVRNCEKGLTVNEQSALQILQAVNHWLKVRGKPETTLEALDIKWR
jgi:DNA-binding transcriptional regulator YiaG